MPQYFVSYAWHSQAQTGHGCLNVNLDAPWQSYEDTKLVIKYINENIKDAHGFSTTCVVLNWRRYEEAEDSPAQSLLEAVTEWRKEFRPTCPESMYQVDKINESCPELVIKLMDILGWED
jgi:hypothetical protein